MPDLVRPSMSPPQRARCPQRDRAGPSSSVGTGSAHWRAPNRTGCACSAAATAASPRHTRNWASVRRAARNAARRQDRRAGTGADDPASRSSIGGVNVQRPTSTVLRRAPVTYYVFDLLSLDGRCGPPPSCPTSAAGSCWPNSGSARDRSCCRPASWTPTARRCWAHRGRTRPARGVVAKRVDSPYQPGRSRSRRTPPPTLRQRPRQEVIIGGWVPERHRAAAIGALLVGVPTEEGLRYVGQAATGFTDATRRELLDRLIKLAQPSSPFVPDGAAS